MMVPQRLKALTTKSQHKNLIVPEPWVPNLRCTDTGRYTVFPISGILAYWCRSVTNPPCRHAGVPLRALQSGGTFERGRGPAKSVLASVWVLERLGTSSQLGRSAAWQSLMEIELFLG